jgi:hypothetical protein
MLLLSESAFNKLVTDCGLAMTKALVSNGKTTTSLNASTGKPFGFPNNIAISYLHIVIEPFSIAQTSYCIFGSEAENCSLYQVHQDA